MEPSDILQRCFRASQVTVCFCQDRVMFSLFPHLCDFNKRASNQSLEIEYQWQDMRQLQPGAYAVAYQSWSLAWKNTHLLSFAQRNHRTDLEHVHTIDQHQLELTRMTSCPCASEPSQIGYTVPLGPCNSMTPHAFWQPRSFDHLRRRVRGKHFLFYGDSLVSAQARVLIHMLHSLCGGDASIDFYEKTQQDRKADFSMGCPGLNASVTYIRCNIEPQNVAAAKAKLSQLQELAIMRRANCSLPHHGRRSNETFLCVGERPASTRSERALLTHLVSGFFVWDFLGPLGNRTGIATQLSKGATAEHIQKLRLQEEQTATASVEHVRHKASRFRTLEHGLAILYPHQEVQIVVQVPVLPDLHFVSTYTGWAFSRASWAQFHRSLRHEVAISYQQMALERGWWFLDAQVVFEQYAALSSPLQLMLPDGVHPVTPSVPLQQNILLLHFDDAFHTS